MNRNLENAIYGVLDYAAYPVAMLATAPLTIRFLGPSEYGLWMIAGSLISIGGILGSGFSDAGVQRIAALMAVHDVDGAVRNVQSMLAISVACGGTIALAVFSLASSAAAHIQAHTVCSISSCVTVVRLAALGILLRCVTASAISAQRALQRYRSATLINVCLHTGSLVAALLLATARFHVETIVAVIVLFMAIAAIAQWHQAMRLLTPHILRPQFRGLHTRTLLHDGFLLWLQTVAAVASERLDRVVLGFAVGAAAVTPYVVCVQIAQPLCGITGSALGFLFPFLSQKASTASVAAVRMTVAKAFTINLVLVSAGLISTLVLGKVFLNRWVGASVGTQASMYLLPVALGSAFVGASVTGIFALQAVRAFRTLSVLLLTTRAISVIAMLILLAHFGARGLATARLVAGAGALLVYIPTWRAFHPGVDVGTPFSSVAAVREGAPL